MLSCEGEVLTLGCLSPPKTINSYKIKRKQDKKMSLCKNGKKLLKNFKNVETSKIVQQEAM